MTCFSPDVGRLNIAAPDPFKRLNYTLGMVLGVDDFRQEQDYHLERLRWLARDLLGYGTVRGLAVHLEKEGPQGWRVHVTKGVAVSPSGQLICVPVDQCCNLNDWLAVQVQDLKNKKAIEKQVLGSSLNQLRLFLTLSYQDCLTDKAPIPGEACRSEDELMQPSRLKDDFCLELRLTPPPQREEDAGRDFVNWLAAIPIEETSPPSMDLEAFLEVLRQAAQPWLSASAPLSSPPGDYMFGTPPSGWRLGRERLRAALRFWVTELRPEWVARYGCGADPPLPSSADDAVLLAELQVPVIQAQGGWVVSDLSVLKIDEERRPFVIHLRLLQELLEGGEGAVAAGDSVVSEQTFGVAPNAGDATAYSRANHTHGTPQLPKLKGDVSGPISNSQVDKIQGVDIVATGAAVGEVLTFKGKKWQPVALPPFPAVQLGGDVSGPAAANKVVSLQGVAVDAPQPAAGQVLTFKDEKWQAVDPQGAPGRFVGRATAGAFDIVAAGRFHIGPDPNATANILVTPLGVYNQLKFEDGNRNFPYLLLFSFKGYKPEAGYVVKLTPGWIENQTIGEFLVYFSGFKDNGFLVQLRSLTGKANIKEQGHLELHIEVSRFVPDRER